jgi:hypothetical protein
MWESWHICTECVVHWFGNSVCWNCKSFDHVQLGSPRMSSSLAYYRSTNSSSAHGIPTPPPGLGVYTLERAA